MLNMIISKTGHSKVAVVVIILEPDREIWIQTGFFGSLYEIFRQELTLRVEIVPSPLVEVSDSSWRWEKHTHNVNEYI